MIDLNTKHILVTGGDITLLQGIITSLQTAGATVTVAHHHWNILDKLHNEFGSNKLPMNWHDLDDTDFTALNLKRIQPIDGAIHCPFWQPVGRFIDSTPPEWDEALQVNYEAAVYLSQTVAKHMIERQVAGSIIFLTSVATQMPFVDSSLYATSLAPLYPLARMAAVDCGQYGIRVNMVAMGWIETESAQSYLTDKGREFITQGIPLQTIGNAESVGDTCCFLLSNLSRYITGTVITVDGGYTLTRSDGQSPYPTDL